MYQVQDKEWVTRGLWTVTNYDWEEAQSNCTIKYNARTTKVSHSKKNKRHIVRRYIARTIHTTSAIILNFYNFKNFNQYHAI
jgi:hypothetical protein